MLDFATYVKPGITIVSCLRNRWKYIHLCFLHLCLVFHKFWTSGWNWVSAHCSFFPLFIISLAQSPGIIYSTLFKLHRISMLSSLHFFFSFFFYSWYHLSNWVWQKWWASCHWGPWWTGCFIWKNRCERCKPVFFYDLPVWRG